MLKTDYDEKMKKLITGRNIAVLCDETTNRKEEAAFITLFKVLPTESCEDPLLFVASVKVLSACNADMTCKAIMEVGDLTVKAISYFY